MRTKKTHQQKIMALESVCTPHIFDRLMTTLAEFWRAHDRIDSLLYDHFGSTWKITQHNKISKTPSSNGKSLWRTFVNCFDIDLWHTFLYFFGVFQANHQQCTNFKWIGSRRSHSPMTTRKSSNHLRSCWMSLFSLERNGIWLGTSINFIDAVKIKCQQLIWLNLWCREIP